MKLSPRRTVRPFRPNALPSAGSRWRRALRVSRSPRAVLRLLSLTPMGAAVAAIAGLPSITVWAQTTGNVIKPDGRTATQQQVMGTRTDITTGTIRGDSAFNSFSRFEVGQGQTVNVVVPSAANRVINIVTDAPIKVEGVLNGLKNGSLSGNLIFADPMGMVVTKDGVINANALQVVAPTRAHLDAMMDGQGRIGDAAVKQLLDGQAPRSEEGKVRIDGRINVLERVRIEARRIDVDGRIKAGADAAHDAAFRAAVSSNGLDNATGMVERGGVIELVGEEVKLAGVLDASQRQALSATAAPEAGVTGVGGAVTLQGEQIELGSASHIDVSGLLGGGTALIGSINRTLPAELAGQDLAPVPAQVLTQNLLVAKGSRVEADAIESGDGGRIQYLSDGSLDFGGFGSSRGGAMRGNGGFVEVSGRRRIQLYGLVDTRAPKGKTGSLLIDPENLYIINCDPNLPVCLSIDDPVDSYITVGSVLDLARSSNVNLQANNTITLGGKDGSAATLDLRSVYTTADHAISLYGTNITFNDNSQLLTGGGAVRLIALGTSDVGGHGTGRFTYRSTLGWGVLAIGQTVPGGKVSLGNGALISTRAVDAAGHLLRDAGDVRVRGHVLELAAGSQILAQGDGGSTYHGGEVELTGYAEVHQALTKAEAISRVTLAGTVKADKISVNAVSRAEASPDGYWGYAVTAVKSAITMLTGLDAAYHETQADANVVVQGSARLEARDTLDIAAASHNKAAGSVGVYTIDKMGNAIGVAAVLVIETRGVADVKVESGATLSSGGKMTIGAYNDATAKGNVKVLSNNAIGSIAVGYVSADVSTNAEIASGANVSAGSLDLLSLQTGNVRNIAMATVAQRPKTESDPNPPQASVGASVAITDIKASSSALLDAKLHNIGNVTVVADTSLWQNYLAARNDVGGDAGLADLAILYAMDKGRDLVKWMTFTPAKLMLVKDFMGALEQAGSNYRGAPPVKVAAVFTLNQTELSAKALLGSHADISASGDVAVVAQTEDRSIHNIAESKVNTTEALSNTPALSGAVALGTYVHAAEATVASGAQVKATRFGLESHVYQPLDVTWLEGLSFDGLRSPGGLLSHFAPPNFGMPQFVFTTWAAAQSEQVPDRETGATGSAGAGAFALSSFKNNSTAWVGAGAKITATGGDSPWSVTWSEFHTPMMDGDVRLIGQPADTASNILKATWAAGDEVAAFATNTVGEVQRFFEGNPAAILGFELNRTAGFTKAVDVSALNESAFLSFTGQPYDIGVLSTKAGVVGGKYAVGGAFNYASAEHKTVAGIDDGAVVKAAAGTVGIRAESLDDIYAVAPTAGEGGGVAANLIGAFSQLDNLTVAVLSNKADVEAQGLDLSALEDVTVWTASGAGAKGANAAGVGIAVSVNKLDGRTIATIGDLADPSLGGVRPQGLSGMSGAVGDVEVNELHVQATTQGTSGALSASAAQVGNKDPNDTKTSLLEDVGEAFYLLGHNLKSAVLGAGKVNQKILRDSKAATPEKPEPPTTSLAVTASTSVNLGNLDTSARVDKATIHSAGASAGSATVQASNDSHQYALSGSIALLRIHAPETKAGYGVSGAIAIDIEDNDTEAVVRNSTVTNLAALSIASLNSGQRIAAGLGIAGGSGIKPTYMLSTSMSMTDSGNDTLASLEGSTVAGSADGHRVAVEVLAYDSTETGVGAGALTKQSTKGGAAGASFAIAKAHNTVEALVSGSTGSLLSELDVRAYDPIKLGAGAASLGIVTGDEKPMTLEASFSYSEVANVTRAFITDLPTARSNLEVSGRVTVQASDVVPPAYRSRFDAILAADGTPEKDSSFDFGDSLRAGEQESFGGQSIGRSQPGALVIGVAGGIAYGAGEAAGAALALSEVSSVHEARVEGATLDVGSLKVDATDNTLIVSVALGVARTDQKIAFAGSTAVTVADGRASALVGNAGKTTAITTDGELDVTAATGDRSFAISGAVGWAGRGWAGGLAGALGLGSNVAEARVTDASISAEGAAKVESTTSSQHITVAASGSYSQRAVINGSFVVNEVTDRSTASVSDSTLSATSLSVKAGDADGSAARVYSGAGSIGYAGNLAGGAAITSNAIALDREAVIEGSTLTLTAAGPGVLAVKANSSADMIGATFAGGGSDKAALNGAIGVNEVANTTTAHVIGSKIDNGGDIDITARDHSVMNYGTGSLSIGGSSLALAGAVSTNIVNNKITAELQGNDAGNSHAGDGKVTARNLRLDASSEALIVNATYGLAGSSAGAGTGSVAVNVITTEVEAHMGRGASVLAQGTVGVLATSQDDIQAFGGALSLAGTTGGGLSSTVNVVRGGTYASIGADGEALVTVDARGKFDGLLVNSSVLESALPGLDAAGTDPADFNHLAAMQGYSATRGKMKETLATATGVVVNATSMRDVLSFDTTGGVSTGGTGFAANADVHVISSATKAEIAHANVNVSLDAALVADAAQDLKVKASSHHVMATLGLGLGGGTGAGAAVLGSATFLTETTAQLRNSQVRAARDVTVFAGNESAQSSLLLGFAAGGQGLAGTAGLVVFDGVVQAAILGGATRAGNDLDVEAENTAVLNLIAGAGTVTSGGGLGGALSIVVADLKTEALIGRVTDGSIGTWVSAGGDIDVSADSSAGIHALTVALSAGGSTSAAAIGSVAAVSNETTAAVRRANVDAGVGSQWYHGIPAGSGGIGDGSDDKHGPEGTLTIQAADHGLLTQASGSGAMSFAGGAVGGTVSVLLARSKVDASLSRSVANVMDLDIEALNHQDQLAATVGVGGSSGLGAGFAISLTKLGTGAAGGEAFGAGPAAKGAQFMAAASSAATSEHLGETGALSEEEKAALLVQSKRDISGLLRDTASNSAAVRVDGSTVRAGGDVALNARQETGVNSMVGSLGVGIAGVGASIGVSEVYNQTTAEILNTSTITAVGDVSVSADSVDASATHKALELTTVSGSAGFGSLGASVGVATLHNEVKAMVASSVTGKSLSVAAHDGTSAEVDNAVAALASGGAVGVAVSTLSRTGQVDARINPTLLSNLVVKAGAVDVLATASGSTEVLSRAGSAGLLGAGNGAAGTVLDDIWVNAAIGDNTQFQLPDAVGSSQRVQVLAHRSAELSSRAEGAGVSAGVQIGGSVALTTFDGETTATVGKGVVFPTAGSLSVVAQEAADNKLSAAATGSGGGLTAAINASYAQADNEATVTAAIGDDTLLPDGHVLVLARHAAEQVSEASGVTVGGILAVGANVADTSTGALSTARLGNVKTRAGRLGDLAVSAQGSDISRAEALAGGGGLVSGQAGVARVDDHSNTLVLVTDKLSTKDKAEAYVLHAGLFALDASHQSQVRADADTVNASVLGASGADAASTVLNQVSTTLGKGVAVSAKGIAISAHNRAVEIHGDDNAAGASGGVLTGSAVLADTSITASSTVLIGQNARLDVIGDASIDAVGNLIIMSGTDIQTDTRATLNTGGLISVPVAKVESTGSGTNTVSIETGAQLHVSGDIMVGTTAVNNTQAESLVNAYGALSAAGGSSNAQSLQTDTIHIKGTALLHAWGDIEIATGRNPLGGLNLVNAQAITDLYNNTLIPITMSHGASSATHQTSHVLIDGGSNIQAGRSVYLRSFEGENQATASGQGHNPYLAMFSTTTEDSHPVTEYRSSVTVDGAVTAGLYHERVFQIDGSGALKQTAGPAETRLELREFKMTASGSYVDSKGAAVSDDEVLRPKDYISKVKDFRPNLYHGAAMAGDLGGVPTDPMAAYVLPNLVAAGGNVEVDTQNLAGAGKLLAQGGPTIQLSNVSNTYVIANRMVIPDIDNGGLVNLLGGASRPGGMTVTELSAARPPVIALYNNYDGSFDLFGNGRASDIVLQASKDGSTTVRNPRGAFTMVNLRGNIVGAPIDALTVDISAPNATYVQPFVDRYLAVGGEPQNAWDAVDALYRPSSLIDFVDTAAFAFYVERFGYETDAERYGKTLQGILDPRGANPTTGWLFHKNIGNVPGNVITAAYNWYNGRYAFDPMPVKTLGTFQPGAKVENASAGIHANRVNIKASTIDLNASIQAGTARDISVTIKDVLAYMDGDGAITAMSFFDCVLSPTCRVYNDIKPAANGRYKVSSEALVYGAGSSLINVYFDPASKRLSTDPIGTPVAGDVRLEGRILNSNASTDPTRKSKIELASGAIRLDIDNQSGRALDLPRIETGGAASPGEISVTDWNRTQDGRPLVTRWISTDGSSFKRYEGYGEIDIRFAAPTETGTGTSQFNPQAGWRYEWAREATATRQLINGGGDWAAWKVTDWEFENRAAKPVWSVKSSGPVFDPVFEDQSGVAYRSNLSSRTDFNTVNTTYTAYHPVSATWNVATRTTLVQSSSVRADYGVGISFKGNATGAVVIASNADTFLTKSLNNIGNDTSISLSGNASLLASSSGLIESRNLSLFGDGNFGGLDGSAALGVRLSGSLSAYGSGSLNIKAKGTLLLGRVNAGNGKTVRLAAEEDIRGGSIKGFDVQLHSDTGRIGGATASDALNIELLNRGSDVTQRGVLSAEALGDVRIALTGGNARLSSLQSGNGDVWLSADGSLFDARQGTSTGLRSADELQTLWDSTLNLSGDLGASVKGMLTRTIAPLDQQVNRDYRAYWQLLPLGQIGADGRIQLNPAGLATLRAQTAAQLRQTTATDAQVNAWANVLLTRYTGTFASVFGTGGWRNLPEFQSLQAGYRFSADRYNEYWQLIRATEAGQLTPAGREQVRAIAATVLGGTPSDSQLQAYVSGRLAALTGSFSGALGAGWATQPAFANYDPGYSFAGDTLLGNFAFGNFWGADRLQNTIRLSAIGQPGSAVPTPDYLNIAGKHVTVQASSPTGSSPKLGSYGSVDIALDQPLSPEQRSALAQAVAPGDVQVKVDASGNVVGLLVRESRPLFVEATEQLDASAKGGITLLSPGTMHVGQIISSGVASTVRLQAQDGIAAVAPTATPAVQGAMLVLDAGRGSIGSAEAPLEIKAGFINLAKAGEGIYLTQPEGRMNIDLVSAGKNVTLNVLDGDLWQMTPGLLSLSGESLNLNVAGSIGYKRTLVFIPLVLQTLGGELSLTADNAWITAAGTTLKLADSTVAGQFQLAAPGNTALQLTGELSVGAGAQLLLGGAFTTAANTKLSAGADLVLTAASVDMAPGSQLSSGGKIALYSGGDASLGALTAQTGMQLDAEQGRISGNGPQAVMTVTNGALEINSLNTAGQGVGTGLGESEALRVAAHTVSVRSTQGDANLHLLNPLVSLNASTLEQGSLRLQADGSLNLAGIVQAGQEASITAAGAFTIEGLRLLAAGADLKVDAASVRVPSSISLSSEHGAVSVFARTGDATLGTVSALTGIGVDAPLGRISSAGISDRLIASGPDALVALNANNSGGLGLGGDFGALVVQADRLSARSASGGILLELTKPLTTVEQLLAGTGDISLQTSGGLKFTGPVAGTDFVTVFASGDVSASDRIEALGLGRLLVQGASLDLAGPVISSGNATLRSTDGDLRVSESLRAGGSATLVSAAAAQLQDVEAVQGISITAAGAVTGDRLKAGQALTVTGAPEFTVRELISGADMSLTVGKAEIMALTSGGLLSLNATQARLDAATITGAASLVLSGDLALGTLDTQGALGITADSMDISGAVSAGGSATLTSAGGGLLMRTSLKTGGSAMLASAAAAQLQDVDAAQDLSIDAAGAVTGDRLKAGRNLVVTRAPEFTVRELISGAGMSLALGNAAIQNLTAGGAFSLNAADAQIGQAALGANASMAASGALRIGQAGIAGALDLSALDIELGSVQVGGATQLRASRGLDVSGILDSQGALSVTADRVAGGTLRSGSSVSLGAGSAALGALVAGSTADLSASTLSLGSLVAGGSAVVSAGAFDAASLSAGSLSVSANSAAIGTAAVGGAAGFNVTGALDLGVAAIGGAAELKAGSIMVRTSLKAGGSATLASAGAAHLQDVEATQDLTLDALGAVTGDRLKAGRQLTVTRAPEFSVRELISGAGMSLALGKADIQTLTAGAGLVLQATDARIGQATVGANANIAVSGTLSLGQADIAGALDLRAQTALLGALKVGTGLQLDVAGALAIASLSSQGALALTAGSIDAGLLSSNSTVDLTAAEISIDELKAGSHARLNASGALDLGQAAIGGTLDVRAGSLLLSGAVSAGGNATLTSTGGDLLIRKSLMTGGSATLVSAAAAQLQDVEAAQDISIDALRAVTGDRLKAGRHLVVTRAPEFTMRELISGADMSLALGLADIQNLRAGAGLVLKASDARIAQATVGAGAQMDLSGTLDLGQASIAGALDLAAQTAQLGTVQIGGAADLVVAGELEIADLNSQGALDLKAGSLAAGLLRSAGNAGLSAAAMSIDSLGSGGNARLVSTGGDLLIRKSLTAGGSATLVSAAGAQLQDVEAVQDIGIDAAAAVTGDRLKAGRALTVTKATELALRELSSGADMSLTTARADVSRLSAGGNLSLNAAQARLGTAAATGAASVSLTGDLDVDSLSAQGALNVQADHIRAAALNSKALMDVRARQAELNTLQAQAGAGLVIQEALVLGAADVAGRLDLSAGSLALGALTVGGNTQLTVAATLRQSGKSRLGGTLQAQARDLDLASLEVAGEATLQASSALHLGELNAAKALTLKADALTLDKGHAAGALALSANTARLTELSVDGDASLTVARDLRLNGSSKYAAGLQAQAQSLSADALLLGGLSSLEASEAMQITALDAKKALTLKAGALTLASLVAGGDLAIDSKALNARLLKAEGKVRLNADSALIEQAELAGATELALTGALRVDKGLLGSTLQATAASMLFDQLQVAGDATLSASGLLKASQLNVGGTLTASGAPVELGTIGGARAAADAAPAAGVRIGGALKLSGDRIMLASAEVAGDATLTAQQGLRLEGSSQFKSALTAVADSMQLNAVSVSGATDLRSKTSLGLDQLDSAGTAFLRGTQLSLGQLNVQKALDIAGVGLTLTGLKSGGALKLRLSADADIGQLELAGLADLEAGGSVSLKSLDAPRVSLTAGKDVTLDLLKATHAEITTPTQIALKDGRIGSELVLHADRIQAGLSAAAGDTAVISTSVGGIDGGSGGGRASQVAISLATPTAWILPSLNVVDAQFSSAGAWVQFDNATVTGVMALTTPNGLLAMSNAARPQPGADVQLYSQDGHFVLLRDRHYAYTTALALSYKPGQYVSAPNTMLSPLASAQNSSAVANGTQAASPARLALASLAGNPLLDVEQLLRNAPTASGQDDELVGTLEFE